MQMEIPALHAVPISKMKVKVPAAVKSTMGGHSAVGRTLPALKIYTTLLDYLLLFISFIISSEGNEGN